MTGSTVGPAQVSVELGLDGDAYRGWLAALAAAGRPQDSTPRYSRSESAARLRELGLSERDAEEAAASAPDPEYDPELWWLLERCSHLLHRAMGQPGPMWHWPSLPVDLGERGRWFFVHVFLALAPAVSEWNRALGVPDDVVGATLADLGVKVGLHRTVHGVGGLDKQSWLTLHFRGAVHRLGALQFERVDLPAGTVPGVEGAALSVHIPEEGPLSPAACDESFRWARQFFPRYFPARPWERAVCVSWLLDPQLARYLDADSNIMRFQRRFRLAPFDEGVRPDDRAVMEYVFRMLDPAWDELPRRTSLQRAVVDHLRAGGHWRMHPGWLPLD